MKDDSQARPYRQTARAKAAAETAERILDAFMTRMESCWFDEIRLEDIAADAGVTVQTVIRRFGGKDGLLASAQEVMSDNISAGRQVPAGNAARALDVVIAEYEALGGLVIRLLAQEERYAPIKATTDIGRAYHREWVGTVFAPWLEAMPAEERRYAHDRLVIALDVYVWKLVRVDMQRTKAQLRRTMLDLCAQALGVEPETLELNSTRATEAAHG